MSTLALQRDAARHRRQTLARLVGAASARASTVLLLGDALAAIGFAGGLALAISALTTGGAILPGLALALVSGLARASCAALALRAGGRSAGAVKARVRAATLLAALRRPRGGVQATGAVIQSVVDDVEALDGHVARFLPARGAAALAPMLVLAATALASPVAAGILAATLLPFILALALAGGAAADESRRQFHALSRLSGLLADRVRALPIILAFRAEAREADRIGAAAQEVAARTLKVLRVAFLSTGALEFFAALSVALVAVYAGFNLLGELPFPVPEQLDLGRAFFVLALAPEFYGPMRRLAAAYHDRQAAESAAQQLAALHAEAATDPEYTPMLCAPPSITFDGVTIAYPDSPEAAVRNLSFSVAPGAIVALTGPSGSGKSSILQLLLGLAPHSGGVVRIGGEALAPGTSLARSASWAGQAPLILPGTLAGNIALGAPDASAAQIAQAAVAAGLEPMLMQREGGLESTIDPRGGGLSGGERRRIGLARALLKPAPILLLDEPTAHLDPAAEDALIALIARAARGRTTLIATHSARLAAIADMVVDLGDRR
ncbi:thiol reductant ABC exporter subunit CydD [Sphingomonas suaedae]|uniref:Thiol reductant ABC exporter subunit CydD n=1 Tax=Sphingomonas suaedae TaxID=2599297 RepID=A0A518RJ09_9SPHN|nr:thiol reductant ABC exporter subunit CydD [Sphingomonas suaedae]QDX27423.1 thiol reductant ABC exporter subunit CydD [Sphingomonas suaedae]